MVGQKSHTVKPRPDRIGTIFIQVDTGEPVIEFYGDGVLCRLEGNER